MAWSYWKFKCRWTYSWQKSLLKSLDEYYQGFLQQLAVPTCFLCDNHWDVGQMCGCWFSSLQTLGHQDFWAPWPQFFWHSCLWSSFQEMYPIEVSFQTSSDSVYCVFSQWCFLMSYTWNSVVYQRKIEHHTSYISFGHLSKHNLKSRIGHLLLEYSGKHFWDNQPGFVAFFKNNFHLQSTILYL